MKKWFVVFLISLLLIGCKSTQKEQEEKEVRKETPMFESLNKLSFEEVDQFLADKKSGILYFGWIENCGDSVNFQENYLEDLLTQQPDLKEKIFVVNLDQEAPDALVDKELRKPMTEKYDVAYSPTLLSVVEGKTVEKIEWELKTSDPETAIAREELDKFFNNTGYLK